MNVFLRSAALAGTLLLVGTSVASAQGGTGTLAYQVAGQGVYTIGAAGGTPDLIVAGGSLPAYSPNGNQLAFIKGNGLYVAKANGSKAKRLTSLPTAGATAKVAISAGGPPAWSPNGKQIAFANDGTIQIIDATGGKPKTIVTYDKPSFSTSGANHPQWSSSGRSIYYLASNAILGSTALPGVTVASVAASNGGAFQTIATTVETPPFPGLGIPYWVATNFTLSYSGAAQAFALTLQQLTASASQNGPVGTPTGQFAAATLPQGGGTVTNLQSFSSAAWSPDGTELCATGPLGALVVIEPDGSFVSEPLPATGNPATGPNGCTWQP